MFHAASVLFVSLCSVPQGEEQVHSGYICRYWSVPAAFPWSLPSLVIIVKTYGLTYSRYDVRRGTGSDETLYSSLDGQETSPVEPVLNRRLLVIRTTPSAPVLAY